MIYQSPTLVKDVISLCSVRKSSFLLDPWLSSSVALNVLINISKTKFSIFTDYDCSSYGRNTYSTQRVKGQFDNGSYVTLDVHSNGKYKIVKKYDAEMVAMVSDQVMGFFAKQNK